MDGGAGNDTFIVYGTSFDMVKAAAQGIDLVKSTVSFELGANFENLQLLDAGDINGTGNTLASTLTGSAGDNRLHGYAGSDKLYGGSGNDWLFGGAGFDVLTGDVCATGGYDDVFVFQKITDSTNNALADRITDFHIGEDKIDLSAIDAKSSTPANDGFTFITKAFTNVAGQLRLQTSGADTFVLGDVNGDGVADFRIVLTGNLALTASDFIL